MSSQPDGAPQRSQPRRVDPGVLLADLGQGLRTTLAGAVESGGRVTLAPATVRPGPDGVLRAPLSGQPCVWFRAMTVPSARWLPLSFSHDRRTLPSVAPSDLPYVGVLSDASSTTPFVVADEGGRVGAGLAGAGRRRHPRADGERADARRRGARRVDPAGRRPRAGRRRGRPPRRRDRLSCSTPPARRW
ncbi:hypothetical protein GCM10023340_23680 [Nocardioides marinquilinus]|uniref:Uncharacterized protein n=1 Tax=Nocardioides marinquilinus TaxID=1210400 RepID=A0ABP9PMF3_9ACTN